MNPRMPKLTKTTSLFLSLLTLILLTRSIALAFEDSNSIHANGSISNSVVVPTKYNELIIALDTLRSTDTPQVIIDFMKTWHYNALRIYVGWCSSIWSGNLNDPMNSASKTKVDQLCDLCAQNGWNVTCMISDQVSPWVSYAPEEIQVGPSGQQNSQGNWVDVTGPKMINFSRNLAVTLVDIMDNYATPRLSMGEFVYVTAGGYPAFYAQSMRDSYLADTGQQIPSFTDTTRPWTSSQQAFLNYVANRIEDFYEIIRTACLAENSTTFFDVLLDTYWVYPNSSEDSQPWDYYATEAINQITYEWFYAIQNENWAGIIDGLQRIKDLNPSVIHCFLYGTSTMTTIENMRYSVQLAMDADYDGVSLYEYAKSKSDPFDVSDIVFG